MSTARTAIGCLAEDYPQELAQICIEWADRTRTELAVLRTEPNEEDQRLLDVADSIAMVVGASE